MGQSGGKRTTNGRVLGVDYGRKRIGLAVADELGITVQPLLTMQRRNRRDDLRRLREIAREEGIGCIVVGHPLHMEGVRGEMAEEAAAFATRLGRETGLPVTLADERLTSWAADEMKSEAYKAGVRHKAGRDAVAACLILREYLARARKA